MKKKLFTLLAVLILIFSQGTKTIYADEDSSVSDSALKVVDTADIFTSEEETKLENRLEEIVEEVERDIVIYTDVSTYGKERSVAAADFFEQGNYGYGEEKEGMCLFICMDPDDRGWWCCCHGSDTRSLYTEAVANSLDNVLSRYMGNGQYYDGIAAWLENVRTMYLKGLPFAPDWMPERNTEFIRTHNTSEPRVTDFTDTLTSDQLESLENRAQEISDSYGIDFALNITSSTYGMSTSQYMSNLYLYKGYGLNDDYDGVLITFHTFFGNCDIYTEGAGSEGLTEKNIEKLSKLSSTDDENEVYEKAMLFMDTYETLRTTGRIPHSFVFWLIFMIAGVIVGVVFALIKTGGAKKKMKTVQMATGAKEYVVEDSISVSNMGDYYLGSYTERIFDPVRRPDDDHDGNSMDSSSYSSSYESSSGDSYSGSGRDF